MENAFHSFFAFPDSFSARGSGANFLWWAVLLEDLADLAILH